jgi:hypothetical protein
MKKMMYTLLLGVAAMAAITANAQTPTYPYTFSYSTQAAPAGMIPL